MVKICKYVYKAVDTELICIWDCGKKGFTFVASSSDTQNEVP